MTRFLCGLFIVVQASWALALDTKPLRSIPVQLAFETPVESPNHLSLCNGLLWTFSESTQMLKGIDPLSGILKKNFVLPVSLVGAGPVDLSAITCQLNRMLLLINSKPRGFVLELHIEGENIRPGNKFLLPLVKERATDLFCNLQQCWLLQGDPLITYNFKKWYGIWAPLPTELKKAYGHPKLDPFEDWQASLVLAKGQYVKGAIDQYNQFILLDPFHSQAVIRSGAEWVKWGSFGAWEGSFLSAKSLAFVAENVLAVADSKLKAIFLYRRDGVYLGILSWGKDKIFSPDYPLGLAASGNHIYVADFRANKIIAVTLKDYKSKLEEVPPVSIRQNLFRREEVLQDSPSSLCLNCHDGTVSNQLYKFIKLHFHHPLECSQCHDAHHTSKTPHHLKDTPPGLCQSCHKDYSDQKTNHVWSSLNKKGGSCTDCHRSHTEVGKLLIAETPQLCVDCHQDHPIHHKPVEEMTILNQAKGISVHDGKISCLTCHQTHINWKETHFVKDPNVVGPFCASCHGVKARQLFLDFHKLMKNKGGPK